MNLQQATVFHVHRIMHKFASNPVTFLNHIYIAADCNWNTVLQKSKFIPAREGEILSASIISSITAWVIANNPALVIVVTACK